MAPINDLVDELRRSDRGWLPYVAPIYGGVRAEMLHIFRDPGPMTNDAAGGSGFLCLENDDPAAELLADLLDGVGVVPSRTLTWNAYPWYINQKPIAAEIEAGVEPLRRLLDLLPALKVVMLQGGDAKAHWRKFVRRHRAIPPTLTAIETYHTGRQAFIGTAEVREQRMRDLQAAFEEAARILGT